MKLSTLLLIVLCLKCAPGWADIHIVKNIKFCQCVNEKNHAKSAPRLEQEAKEHNGYEWPVNSTTTAHFHSSSTISQPLIWCVLDINGQESYSLHDFISSGRLCEFRGGHVWQEISTGEIMALGMGTFKFPDYRRYTCVLCGKSKRVFTEEREEVEK